MRQLQNSGSMHLKIWLSLRLKPGCAVVGEEGQKRFDFGERFFGGGLPKSDEFLRSGEIFPVEIGSFGVDGDVGHVLF